MKAIYLDYNATTPVLPEVLAKMLPYFCENFGNPASINHEFGWVAEKAVQEARAKVAQLIHATAHEIYFTSGATEANNWVVRGLIDQFRSASPGEIIHLITSPVEHNSIVNAFKWAADQPNIEVSWCTVDKYGRVDLDSVKSLIRPETKLMSFMWVNNELGTVNPMAELTALAKAKEIYLHSDATQAVGKLEVDMEKIPVDLLSFSGHKIYGPKGIGALYVRVKNPTVQIMPLLHGGSHERGLRAGTLNVPGIIGLGEACQIAAETWSNEGLRQSDLRGQFSQQLKQHFPNLQVNGHPEFCGPNTLNVTFRDHIIPSQFSEVAVSRGSACQSGSTSISQVLKAIGLSEIDAHNTIRFSFGKQTSGSDLNRALEYLKSSIRPREHLSKV